MHTFMVDTIVPGACDDGRTYFLVPRGTTVCRAEGNGWDTFLLGHLSAPGVWLRRCGEEITWLTSAHFADGSKAAEARVFLLDLYKNLLKPHAVAVRYCSFCRLWLEARENLGWPCSCVADFERGFADCFLPICDKCYEKAAHATLSRSEFHCAVCLDLREIARIISGASEPS
jgi:hypothetical protein